MKKEGNIKISSENMMPIIKKWLYSDKDIFLREIVANGVDAITKYKKLVDMGEAKEDGKEYCVKISVDKKAKTLTVEDNGLGMTEDEVEKYITQLPFPARPISLRSMRKPVATGLSDISVWGSTPLLWWRRRSRSSPSRIKRGHRR